MREQKHRSLLVIQKDFLYYKLLKQFIMIRLSLSYLPEGLTCETAVKLFIWILNTG